MKDPVLTVLNLIKAQWTETDPDVESIHFYTAPIDIDITEPPSIQIYRPKSSAEARWVRAPWRVVSIPLTIGSHPIYLILHPLRIDIILKPNDTTSSIGIAKKQKWNMIEEVQRILRANAFQQDNIEFIEVDSFWEDDDYTVHPPLVTGAVVIKCIYQRQ